MSQGFTSSRKPDPAGRVSGDEAEERLRSRFFKKPNVIRLCFVLEKPREWSFLLVKSGLVYLCKRRSGAIVCFSSKWALLLTGSSDSSQWSPPGL